MLHQAEDVMSEFAAAEVKLSTWAHSQARASPF